jgi:HAE1 family hydrophobic/amphiphilic exporter-1
MNEITDFANVNIAMDLTKLKYQVKIDRTRAAEVGVSVADMSTALRSLISGTTATKSENGDQYYNIRVPVPEKDLNSLQNAENLPVAYGQGGFLRVRDVAKAIPAVGPIEIVRSGQFQDPGDRSTPWGSGLSPETGKGEWISFQARRLARIVFLVGKFEPAMRP